MIDIMLGWRRLTPISLYRHRGRWTTMKLLLDRGADPNASSVPMPVLFLAIKAGHIQAVRRLLECGARTDMCLPSEVGYLSPSFFSFSLSAPLTKHMVFS